MKKILVVLLLFQFVLAAGQQDIPKIISGSTTCEGFIPEGWNLICKESGDLNLDKRDDLAFVIQKADKSNIRINAGLGNDTIDLNPRVLIVAFYDTTVNSFRLVCQNNTFILKHDEPTMEEPFQGIEIQNGKLIITFSIFYNAGSWGVTSARYQFRYQKNTFALIGADVTSFMRNSGDSESYSLNFLTKKMSVTTGNEFVESIVPKTTWKKIQIKEIPTMNTFTAPFTLTINEDLII
jgi:hypothetical protein